MRRIVIIISHLIIAVNFAAAQRVPELRWQKCFGGSGAEFIADLGGQTGGFGFGYIKALVASPDGGFVFGGQVGTNSDFVPNVYGMYDIVIVKIDKAKNITWKTTIGGSKRDLLFSIQSDHDGGYIIGATTESTDGDAAGNHSAHQDVLIIKLDRNGKIIWKKCFGGTDIDTGGQIAVVNDGYVFSASTYSYDGDIVGRANEAGFTDNWIVKLDFSGNIIWQRFFGGSYNDYECTIKKTSDGGFIALGYTTSTDRDAIVIPPSTAAGADLWFIKLDGNGQIQWQNRWNNTGRDWPQDIEETADGGFVAVAQIEYPSSASQGAIIRIDQNGKFLWHKIMGGPRDDSFTDVVVAPDNTFTVTGYAQGQPGSDNLYDVCVINFDNNGELKWQKNFGGTKNDLACSIIRTFDDTYYIFGNTFSNDKDVSGFNGGVDFWLFQIGDYNTITGRVFYDTNRNGIKDANELFSDNLKIIAEKNGNTHSSIPSNGLFNIYTDTGNYIIKVLPNEPYFTTLPLSKTVGFTNYANTDTIDFAIQPEPGHRDLSISINNLTPARPGFAAWYKITYKNIGTETIAAGTVTLINDPRLDFAEASPVHSSQSGDTTRWNFTDLQPGQSVSIEIKFVVNAAETIAGNILELIANIRPINNDEAPANNSAAISHRVTGSYDPNDKSESNAGIFTPAKVSNGAYLTYLIRFQNVGTDTAFNIIVRDTLDPKLDWNSLQMESASHSYSLQAKEGNKLTWTFENILLPDSSVNERGSNGYIILKIKPLAGVATGDIIRNSASIYFDYNLPVRTNITVTEIKPARPRDPLISSVQPNYCGAAEIQKVKILNLPATGSNVTVVIKIDGVAVPTAADSTFSFNPATLAEGSHTIAVEFSNSTDTRIKSSTFNITGAVNPNVDLSANITNITNIAMPVIVSATNTAGGGNSPLFTFALDRNFTNIIRQESIIHILNIDASTLAIGDNKIFVRMKTSAACFVVNTAVDSIVLVRSSVTGINDPDMPGQAINIYPNPFMDKITINGLSTSKIYTFRLFNLEGKLLSSKRVSGRSTILIESQHQPTGIYWLSIYDEKSNKLLGTVKLIKE